MYSKDYPIYDSLLRQDLYKFNMGRVIKEKYNEQEGTNQVARRARLQVCQL